MSFGRDIAGGVAAAVGGMLVVLALACVAIGILIGAALAQEHRHPTGVIPGETGRYYDTWRMPDDRSKSCCSRADCYDTEARFVNGGWMAKRREDGKWLSVPDKKVEQERDSPDGLSHLCAPPPRPNYFGDPVFCFVPGSGA